MFGKNREHDLEMREKTVKESSTVQIIVGTAILLPTPDTGVRIIATLFCCCVSEGIRKARRRTYCLAIVITIGGRCISKTICVTI